MLRKARRDVRLTGPYSQPPTTAHAHASCSIMARSLRQLHIGRHDDIDVSLWAGSSGCDKRECEMRESKRSVQHPLVDPLVADLVLAIDITSSPIRCRHFILLNDDNIFAVLSQASRVVFSDVT